MYFQYYGATREKAKDLRKNMTPWESKLWYDFLRRYRIRFRRQVVVHGYIVDFCCNRLKLILELDGGGRFIPQQRRYDKIRTETLEREGYRVVRINNDDIVGNFYGVCSYIDREVGRLLALTPQPTAAPLSRGAKR